MKILVTGGAGFIGSNLVDLLVEDHEVVVIDNFSKGTLDNCNKGAQTLAMDLVDDAHVWFSQLKDIDIIFHLAAMSRIQPSLINPLITLNNNYLATTYVLEYARMNNCKVIYSGSSSFHGGIYNSPYALSKHQSEQLCKVYTDNFNVETIIPRFYNVYGNRHIEFGPDATVIGIWEKQYRENKPLTITGDGTQSRDFTHIDDITSALKLMMGYQGNADIFELGRGESFDLNTIASWFNTDIKYISARKGEYPYTLCDPTPASKLLGWNPQRNLREYIGDLCK